MEKNIYNLYIVIGTLPNLYARINMLRDKKPSYIWFRSEGVFKFKNNMIPEHIKTYSKLKQSNSEDYEFVSEHYKSVVNVIKDIKARDSNAYFHIFCDDSRIQFVLKPIVFSGLVKEEYEITIISEGTITEAMYKELSPNDEVENSTYWNELVQMCRDEVNNKKSSDELNHKLIKISNYAFWFSTLDNVQYLIPCERYLKNFNVDSSYKKKMHIINHDIEADFKNLSENEKEMFFGDIFLENGNLEKLLKKDCKKIIITGTYGFGDADFTLFAYKNLISKAIEDYGDQYKLLYKAHPAFRSEKKEELEEFLTKNDIEIIPDKMPLEILLWTYPQIGAGGFCSSTYYLIDPMQVKFFFGEIFSLPYCMYKEDLFDCKTYNLEVSQRMATLFLKKNREKIENNAVVEEKFKEQTILINLSDNRITDLEARTKELEKSYIELVNSRSWKITKPLRGIGDFARRLKKIIKKLFSRGE